MPLYRVVAVSDAVTNAVRATRAAPGYGHPAHSEIATGHGPCRQCLRTFAIGEDRRLLFTYDPFGHNERLPLPGPVFIHELPCIRYAEDAGFPEDLRPFSLTLNAYGRGRWLRAQKYVSDGRVEAVIGQLFARGDVDYIHVRDTEAGCFDFSVEPTEAHAATLFSARGVPRDDE